MLNICEVLHSYNHECVLSLLNTGKTKTLRVLIKPPCHLILTAHVILLPEVKKWNHCFPPPCPSTTVYKVLQTQSLIECHLPNIAALWPLYPHRFHTLWQELTFILGPLDFSKNLRTYEFHTMLKAILKYVPTIIPRIMIAVANAAVLCACGFLNISHHWSSLIILQISWLATCLH